MSASSVRRLKDRGGGTSVVSAKAPVLRPSKALTPVSNKIPGGEILKKSSTGKENPRSTSRGRGPPISQTQKPVIRAVPRVDKASVVSLGNEGDTRVRWSTSSVPRGRSSSPSEFIKVFSDIRKGRRVSVDQIEKGPIGKSDKAVSSGDKGLKGSKSLQVANQKNGNRDSNVKLGEARINGIRFVGATKENVNISVIAMAKTGNCGELEKKTGESKNNCDKDGSLSSTLIKSSAVHARGTSLFCGEKGGSECNVKVQNGLGVDEEHSTVSVLNVGTVNVVNATDSCLTERCEKSLTNTKVLEIAKEKGLDDRGTACSIGNKYPSKLHEKLAFLEGKVKRISSDIRRTKEMLDMNNSDTSKVILSDIQDKISGIEKAMSHVKSDSDTKMGFLKVNGNDQELNVVDKCQIEQDNVTCSVKGLNSEELEARLFPHHKLLRNRTSTKASSGSSLSNESHVFTLESKVDEKLLSPIDENPIALEFLASLNKGQRKANIGDHHDDLYEPQATDGAACAGGKDSSYISNKNNAAELLLTTDEKLDDFDDQENRHSSLIEQELEDTSIYQLNEIGHKTSTGGWFVSEGEAVLLAHDDGSCSYYDIANCEEKAVYNPPLEVLPNIWRDCWVIRAPGADGCSGRFVVAASAGNTMDSGFCSWDFYSKQVRAFHVDSGTTASRTILGPLPNNIVQRRNFSSNTLVPETRQWWYRPCGPLIISTATSQKVMKAYDIRDGEEIMKWEVQKPVLTMEYSSPLQWRNRGKVVVAEAETISVWDVNTINPQALLSIPSTGQKISALHVSNTEAELGGGVRQRVSSSEAEGNDGVFCTSDYINVLDFRHPSGVGLKISKLGVNVQSVFSRGDSIFLGCTSLRSVGKKQALSQVQQFSLRKQGLYSTYALPESNAHLYHAAITQVWGNSDFVMGVSGLGLFVFDALKDHMQQAVKTDYGKTENVKEVIGPDDLYSPSFDYMGSRALLISRDRPALWRHLS